MKTFILTIFGFLALANAQYTAPRRAQKTNDDYYDYEAPTARYVQLFSWSLSASILNCFYRIFVKKWNTKDPSKWKIMHQKCEKKFTKIL